MSFKRIVCNPYFLYSIGFIIMLFSYKLEWSFLNPRINTSTYVFLSVTIFLSFLIGFVYDRFVFFNGKKEIIKIEKHKLVNKFILIITLLEIIYSKGAPLIGFWNGAIISYSNFGIPTIHVILLTISFYWILMNFQTFLNQNKKMRKKNIKSIIVGMLPFIISINRGMLVMIFLTCIFVYVSTINKKIGLKKIFAVLILVFFSAYLFGLFGNYRLNKDYQRDYKITDSSLIKTLGGATAKVDNSSIPDEFFWTYSYVSTPLANLQTAINSKPQMGNVSNEEIWNFFLALFVPDFISNKFDTGQITKYRIVEEMTVGTGYYYAYLRLGWEGLFLYFLVLIFYAIAVIVITRSVAPEFLILSNSVLCTIYVLMFFSNFLSYTGLVLLLFFPIIISLYRKIRWKK